MGAPVMGGEVRGPAITGDKQNRRAFSEPVEQIDDVVLQCGVYFELTAILRPLQVCPTRSIGWRSLWLWDGLPLRQPRQSMSGENANLQHLRIILFALIAQQWRSFLRVLDCNFLCCAAPWSSSACGGAEPLRTPMCPMRWLLPPPQQQSPGSSRSSASTFMLVCCISHLAVNLSRC